MQTFYEPKSPVAKALNAGRNLAYKAGDAVRALQGRNDAIQAIADYNPELAQRANTIRGYQSEAAGIRPSTSAPKQSPVLPPAKPLQTEPTLEASPEELAQQQVKQPERVAPPNRPTTPPPVKQTIGPEDIQQAKAEALQKKADWIRHRTGWIASGVTGYRMISQIFRGDFSSVPMDLAEGAVAMGAAETAARLLENPKIVKMLTEPTPRDVAQIPPDLRRNLAPVIKAAQAKGIRVAPALAVGVTGAATVGNRNQ
jgi:hypothetical protein